MRKEEQQKRQCKEQIRAQLKLLHNLFLTICDAWLIKQKTVYIIHNLSQRECASSHIRGLNKVVCYELAWLSQSMWQGTCFHKWDPPLPWAHVWGHDGHVERIVFQRFSSFIQHYAFENWVLKRQNALDSRCLHNIMNIHIKCAQYNEYGGQIFWKLWEAFLGLKPHCSFELDMRCPKVMACVRPFKEIPSRGVCGKGIMYVQNTGKSNYWSQNYLDICFWYILKFASKTGWSVLG